MAKSKIISKKVIANLGNRDLRITTMNGEDKWDIRHWDGDDKYADGVRFSDEEITTLSTIIACLKDVSMQSDMVLGTVGNKKFIISNGEYCLSIDNNGREYIRPFATVEEMNALKIIIDEATSQKTKSLTDYLSDYKPKKKAGRKPKNTGNIVPISIAKKPEPQNGYEKFSDMFATYRKSQPQERQKGFEMSHQIILDHIKDICETSTDYNANLMLPHKNSANMMQYVMNKAFENAEEIMFADKETSIQYICMWVDEYVGLDDAPKKKGRKKKEA